MCNTDIILALGTEKGKVTYYKCELIYTELCIRLPNRNQNVLIVIFTVLPEGATQAEVVKEGRPR